MVSCRYCWSMLAWVRVFYFYGDTCRKYQPTRLNGSCLSRSSGLLSHSGGDENGFWMILVCMWWVVACMVSVGCSHNQITKHQTGLGDQKCAMTTVSDCERMFSYLLATSDREPGRHRKALFYDFYGIGLFSVIYVCVAFLLWSNA